MSGAWLLERTTPSWRIEYPELGFQRVVREDRAKAIAVAVLDQQRTFPNAIVLATDLGRVPESDGSLTFPSTVRFLVVDGQHRLWAQRYSSFQADYACVVHLGLTEVAMAELFLEINDNQKRVPSSLRWDLVRLVRPDDDPDAIVAVELVYELATDRSSPLYQRVDLTGEQSEISLKQGSIAPELKSLVSAKSPLAEQPFDDVYDILVQYLIAVRDLDPDNWGTSSSPYYKARVLRALLRILREILRAENADAGDRGMFDRYLRRINPSSLEPERLRVSQGNAGIAAITAALRADILGTG
jgi:DNA sulfur modification protein DndB